MTLSKKERLLFYYLIFFKHGQKKALFSEKCLSYLGKRGRAFRGQKSYEKRKTNRLCPCYFSPMLVSGKFCLYKPNVRMQNQISYFRKVLFAKQFINLRQRRFFNRMPECLKSIIEAYGREKYQTGKIDGIMIGMFGSQFQKLQKEAKYLKK